MTNEIQNPKQHNEIKQIKLKNGSKYQGLFDKNTGTLGIKAGHIILEPSESVGEHTTDEKEEVIVVLKGKGELIIDKKNNIPIEQDTVLYIPPKTNHGIRNNSDKMLEYIFITY